MLVVAKRLEANGERTEVDGVELTVILEMGGGGVQHTVSDVG